MLSLFSENVILRIDATYSEERRRAFFEQIIIVEAQRAVNDSNEGMPFFSLFFNSKEIGDSTKFF